MKERSGSASNTASPRNVYRCADGKYLALSGSTQAIAKRIFEIIGRADMIEDPRFRTNTDRVKNRALVDEAVGAWFADARPARKRCASCARRAPPSGRSTPSPTPWTTRISASASIIVDVEDAELGALPMHDILPRFSATPGVWQPPAPGLGEHTDVVLKEAGLSAEEIARLRKDGAAA